MIGSLIEKENVWEFLQRSEKPIVMYGMGNGADKMLEILDMYNVKVADIYASDEFVRGHSFRGYKVLKYSDVCEKYDDFVIVMSFAVHDEKTMARIKMQSREHTFLAPDMPVAGERLFTREFVLENEEKFDKVYSLLQDEKSRQTYIDIINFKISGKVEYLFASQTPKSEVYENIILPVEGDIFMDLGAYDGDTVTEFAEFSKNKYKKIIAVEPDAKNFKKLIKNTGDMQNMETYNVGAWSEDAQIEFSSKAGRNSKVSKQGIPIPVRSVDSILNGDRITILKMDIEGSELKALEGARETIKNHTPRLYICAYHRTEDMIDLPLFINEVNPEYKFYFRHHEYIPAWESNFYII